MNTTQQVYGSPVLVLNASYEPLIRVDFRHAVRMLFREVAVVEEAVPGRTIGPYAWPRVLRLLRYVAAKWMHKPAPYDYRTVLYRDRHTCAYCGRHADTVDHVLPRTLGGKSTWLNTVAACEKCNGVKGGRTPEQAGMRLRFEPFVPTRAQLAAYRAD